MSAPEMDSQQLKPAMANVGDSSHPNAQQTVRFASKNQEIEPSRSLHTSTSSTGQLAPVDREYAEPFSSEIKGDMHDLVIKLQRSRLQEARMQNFAFEPVSLPPTRVSEPLFRFSLIWDPGSTSNRFPFHFKVMLSVFKLTPLVRSLQGIRVRKEIEIFRRHPLPDRTLLCWAPRMQNGREVKPIVGS